MFLFVTLFGWKRYSIYEVLELAQEVALVLLWRIDVAIECEESARSLIYGGIAHKWTTHIVAIYIPEATHLEPLAAIYS